MKTECEAWQEKALRWRRTGDPEYPYRFKSDRTTLQVRVNDFPAQQQYTLFIDGRDAGSFDDWPELWDRSE